MCALGASGRLASTVIADGGHHCHENRNPHGLPWPNHSKHRSSKSIRQGMATVWVVAMPSPVRHDLAVGAADLDARIEAALVVGIHHVTAEGLVRPHAAVVGALGARVPIDGPANWPLDIFLQCTMGEEDKVRSHGVGVLVPHSQCARCLYWSG